MSEIALQDRRIHHEEYGNGDPLILIPGLGQDSATWGFQVPVFSKSFRVIAPDNRDSGKSFRSSGPYSTADMADDMIGLMDRLRINRCHLLGISMGGMIVQHMALKMPDRITSMVLASTTSSGEG